MKQLYLILTVFTLAFCVKGDALDEEFGYVEVRPGAHMFWVVYHTELPGDWRDHPLILWLQGGPGSSGPGFGNFKELGPSDTEGNLRNGRWTKKANVMFVDNPVGTGYSYVENHNLLCSNNKEVADDLLMLLKSVFDSYPDMEKMPFFVYAESYGGKMTADFALALDKAIKGGEIKCNFQGIAIGGSWISPMDSVNTWGECLYQTGFVNKAGHTAIEKSAAKTQKAVDEEKWVQATMEWDHTETVIMNVTDGLHLYKVLTSDNSRHAMSGVPTPKSTKNYSFMRPEIRNLYFRHVAPFTDSLTSFMNGAQKQSWNIPDNVVWNSQAGRVFNHMSQDFMKPVVDSVANLLENSPIHVSVYAGDLDLICDTPGTNMWVDSMKYPQKAGFKETSRTLLKVSNAPSNGAYIQRFEKFSVFTFLRSEHMVDVPDMALQMIDMITKYGAETVAAASEPLPLKIKTNIHSSEELPETRLKKPHNAKKLEKVPPKVTKHTTKAKPKQVKENNKVHQEEIKQTQQEFKHQKKQAGTKTENVKPTVFEEVRVDEDVSAILKQNIFEKKPNIRPKLAKLNAKLKAPKSSSGHWSKSSSGHWSKSVDHKKAREIKSRVSQIHQQKVYPVGSKPRF